jgi:hypothetical protein
VTAFAVSIFGIQMVNGSTDVSPAITRTAASNVPYVALLPFAVRPSIHSWCQPVDRSSWMIKKRPVESVVVERP